MSGGKADVPIQRRHIGAHVRVKLSPCRLLGTLISNDQIFDHCFEIVGRDVMVSGFLFNAEVILFSAIPLHAIG
jgi:hypothetical protein